MNNKIIYIGMLIAFLLASISINAQDVLTSNDLNFDISKYNSAFIASSDSPFNLDVSSALGNGLQGTGRFNALGYGVLDKLGLGLGIKVNSRYYGIFKTNTAEFVYAKQLKINAENKVYLGLNMGMHFAGLNMNVLNENISTEDPFLMENEFGKQRFTTGFGLGYTMKDALRIGFSMPGFVKTNNEFNASFIGNVSYKAAATSFFNITPEVIIFGTTASPVTIEGNLRFDYKDFVWLKLAGRSNSTALLNLGWSHKVVSINYGYNLSFGDYSEVNPGVHNIGIVFRLGKHQNKAQKTNRLEENENDHLSKLKTQEEERIAKQDALEREAIRLAAQEAETKRIEAERIAKAERIAALKVEKEAADMEAARLAVLKAAADRKASELAVQQEAETKKQETERVANAEKLSPEKKKVKVPDHTFFVVIESIKDERAAIEFQELVLDKLIMQTSYLIHPETNRYLVYSHSSNDISSCGTEIAKIKRYANKGVIKGKPWIYKQKIIKSTF